MLNNALRNSRFIHFILVALLITSCTDDPEINVEKVEIDFQFNRFDQQLFEPRETLESKIQKFRTQYGEFFMRYCEKVLQVGSPNETAIVQNLKNFIEDKAIQTAYNFVSEEFKNMDAEKTELKKALKRYHYYFPTKIVPQVVTLVSGFAYPIVVTDSILGIGLDMYMGNGFSYYEMMRVPLFRKNRMIRSALVKDAMKGWLQSEFLDESGNKTFLHQIIHQGKLLYAIQKTLPNLAPEIVMGYSTDQWTWCGNHEKAMWGHFVNEKLFYTTLFHDYYKFISEGPFTAAFSRESPDLTGHYMGWQIVNSYMKNNQKVSLNELMNNEDSKQILALSGYKPKK